MLSKNGTLGKRSVDMRPILRGERPLDPEGNPKNFT